MAKLGEKSLRAIRTLTEGKNGRKKGWGERKPLVEKNDNRKVRQTYFLTMTIILRPKKSGRPS